MKEKFNQISGTLHIKRELEVRNKVTHNFTGLSKEFYSGNQHVGLALSPVGSTSLGKAAPSTQF